MEPTVALAEHAAAGIFVLAAFGLVGGEFCLRCRARMRFVRHISARAIICGCDPGQPYE